MSLLGRAVADEPRELSLASLSEKVLISRQTIVRWADRGIINATLHWAIGDDNEEIRLIRIAEDSLDFLKSFAEEYREETVSRTEARRILKLIDRSQVQKLLRHGQLASRKVEDETRVVVGSIEDHLMEVEAA